MNFLFNNKKSLLLVSATALLALSGCTMQNADSSGASLSSDSGTPAAYVNYDLSAMGDPKELTATVDFWTTTGKANGDAINTLVTQFNKVYPHITINALPQGGYTDIEQKIRQAIPTGTTPTMAYCYPDHVASYLNSKAVMNIQNFVDDPAIGFLKANEETEGHHSESGVDKYGADDFVSGYWNEGKAFQSEGLYTVPFTKSTEALYYNKTVFDAKGWSVPETWEDMWNLTSQIKAELPNKTPLGYDSDSNLFISGCKQLDIPYTSATGDHYLFNNASAKSMVQTWVNKYNSGEFVTKGVLPNNQYTSTGFLEQNILMIVSSTAGTSYASTDTFDVGVTRLPHYAGHDLKVISQGPSICFFQRASWTQKYAAWLFYKFCTQATNSGYFATQSTGYDPVRVSSYATDYYTNWLAENNNTLYGQTAQITESLRDDYFYSPVFVGSSTARTAVGEILGNILQSGKTLDQAFDAAINECVNS
jgi:multiple sugar transport system substrate-binding protein